MTSAPPTIAVTIARIGVLSSGAENEIVDPMTYMEEARP